MNFRWLHMAAIALIGLGLLSADALAQRGDRDDDRQEERWRRDRDGDRGRRGRDEDDDRRRDRRGGGWELLGCKDVGFRIDRDVIRVGRDEGRFRAIRLAVSGNTVYLLDLKVVYANGQSDDLQVRSEIRAGGQTRPLDLKGWQRAIRRIELVYRSRPSFRGEARVCAYGLD